MTVSWAVTDGSYRLVLPRADQRYSGVAFTDYRGMAVGSFAAAFGSVAVYGQADGDAIHVLCLHAQRNTKTELLSALVRGLDQALGAFGAVIVHWHRCLVVPAGAVGEYLTAW